MRPEQDTEAVRDYFTREAERFDAIYEGANRSPIQAAVDRLFRTRNLNRRNAIVASLVDEGANCTITELVRKSSMIRTRGTSPIAPCCAAAAPWACC